MTINEIMKSLYNIGIIFPSAKGYDKFLDDHDELSGDEARLGYMISLDEDFEAFYNEHKNEFPVPEANEGEAIGDGLGEGNGESLMNAFIAHVGTKLAENQTFSLDQIENGEITALKNAVKAIDPDNVLSAKSQVDRKALSEKARNVVIRQGLERKSLYNNLADYDGLVKHFDANKKLENRHFDALFTYSGGDSKLKDLAGRLANCPDNEDPTLLKEALGNYVKSKLDSFINDEFVASANADMSDEELVNNWDKIPNSAFREEAENFVTAFKDVLGFSDETYNKYVDDLKKVNAKLGYLYQRMDMIVDPRYSVIDVKLAERADYEVLQDPSEDLMSDYPDSYKYVQKMSLIKQSKKEMLCAEVCASLGMRVSDAESLVFRSADGAPIDDIGILDIPGKSGTVFTAEGKSGERVMCAVAPNGKVLVDPKVNDIEKDYPAPKHPGFLSWLKNIFVKQEDYTKYKEACGKRDAFIKNVTNMKQESENVKTYNKAVRTAAHENNLKKYSKELASALADPNALPEQIERAVARLVICSEGKKRLDSSRVKPAGEIEQQAESRMKDPSLKDAIKYVRESTAVPNDIEKLAGGDVKKIEAILGDEYSKFNIAFKAYKEKRAKAFEDEANKNDRVNDHVKGENVKADGIEETNISENPVQFQ